MSEHHLPSNSDVEKKEDISLSTFQGNQPVSTTLQSVMATPFNSPLPRTFEAAEPTKDSNLAGNPITIDDNDDDSTKSNTDQTNKLIPPSATWKGKGKATAAGHAYSEEEMIAATALLTLSRNVYDMSIETYNHKETDQRTTSGMAHVASGQLPGFPTEIWIKIWTLVANNNPRNVDIWACSVGPKVLWDSEEQRILNDPRNYSHGVRWKPFKFMTTQIVPPVLHINVLSRCIGLEYYRLAFGCRDGMPDIPLDDYSKFEPHIYCHVENDLICPMGRFKPNESDFFWTGFPNGISSIAINLGRLTKSTPKLEDNEDYNKQTAHEQFSKEDWRGLNEELDPLDEMITFFDINYEDQFRGRATRIYMYYFTDYISKRGPRDFRFTPFLEDSDEHVLPPSDVLFDIYPYSSCSLSRYFREAEWLLHLGPDGDDSYERWEKWLQYGGLAWLKGEGPKPCWGQLDNPTPDDQERDEFFSNLDLEEEQDFINRGVPNIGLNSKVWLPGYPEIHSMNLKIHG
ncbi:hypothetical protein ACHAO1_005118 [Botrytis cinerea]